MKIKPSKEFRDKKDFFLKLITMLQASSWTLPTLKSIIDQEIVAEYHQAQQNPLRDK